MLTRRAFNYVGVHGHRSVGPDPNSSGEWEVVGRPYTTNGGKNAHVRVQRANQSGVTETKMWGACGRSVCGERPSDDATATGLSAAAARRPSDRVRGSGPQAISPQLEDHQRLANALRRRVRVHGGRAPEDHLGVVQTMPFWKSGFGGLNILAARSHVRRSSAQTL